MRVLRAYSLHRLRLIWMLTFCVLFLQGAVFNYYWDLKALLLPLMPMALLGTALIAFDRDATHNRLPLMAVIPLLFLLLFRTASLLCQPHVDCLACMAALEEVAILVGATAFVIAASSGRPSDCAPFLAGLLLAALPTAAIAAIAFIIHVVLYGDAQRAISTMGNPNLLSCVLAPLTLVAIWFIMQAKEPLKRQLGVLVFLLFLTGLWGTQSRGAFIGFTCGFALFCFLYTRINAARSRALVLVGFILLAATLMVWAIKRPRLVDTDGARTTAWLAATRMVARYPLTGVGSGRYNAASYSINEIDQSKIMIHAHNLYLQYAAEMGIPGLLSLLVLLVTAGNCAIRSWRITNNEGKAFLAAVSAALVSMLIHSMVDYLFWNPTCSVLFWTLAGLLVAGQSSPPVHKTTSLSNIDAITLCGRNQ